MIQTNFNCGQQEMYNAVRIGWKLCLQFLASFAAFKAKYTEGFVAQHLAATNAADALPSNQARNALAQALRVDLLDKKNEVLTCFQHLKAYIDDAFRPEKQKIMYNAAGQQFYDKAVNNNWASVTGLLSAAIPFIDTNLTTLTANNNMPPDFATKFKQVKAEFEQIYQDWNTADADTYNQTSEKVNTNNAVYANFTAMLTDAQRIFRNDPDTAKLFVAANIIAQTRGTKASGFAGKIVDDATLDALKNATVTVVELAKTVTADKDGRYDFSPIAAGIYTLCIEAESYEPLTINNYEVKTGTTSRLNVNMKTVSVARKVAELV